MTVTKLITSAFRLAAARCPELHRTWITISSSIGTLLPDSMLTATIQRTGEIDMVLRCMEDDFSPAPASSGEADMFSFNYQVMLSELWVGAIYEVSRLLSERKLVPDSEEFKTLAHDLRLLRIPLEKYEIAADRKLSEPLLMVRRPPNNDETDSYSYLTKDPKRSHIMPSGISGRGSAMWQVIDIKSERSSYWLERRDLSERIVALWGTNAA